MKRLMNKRSSKVPPIVEENPDWLLHDPEGGLPPPPVAPRARALTFTDLEWRDFERLCRRLAECNGNVEHVLAYGTQGQAQYGIDILVRLTDGAYEVWQTKRYRQIRAADVRAATSLFLAHRWASQARKFVFAVACDLDNTGVVEAIEEARDRLFRAWPPSSVLNWASKVRRPDRMCLFEPGPRPGSAPPPPIALSKTPGCHRKRDRRAGAAGKIIQPPITVIIGGRALLMLIAARFSGPGSGKDLQSRAISLIASGLLPFSSFPIGLRRGRL